MTLTICLLMLSLPGESTRQGITSLAAVDDTLAIGGHGGVDLHDRGKWISLGEKRNTFALAFSGDELFDAGGEAGRRGEVRAWSWRKRELLWTAEVHDDVIYAVTASGRLLFTGSGDRTIGVLDRRTGERKKFLTGHSGAVLALAVSPGGEHLASGGVDRSIRLWSIADLRLLRTINNHGDRVHALAWSPAGSYLASGSADRSVRVWQPVIGRLVRIIRNHDATILALAHTEKHIVSGASDGKLRLIDASGVTVERVLDSHTDWVTALALTGSGIASADWTGRLVLWRFADLESPEVLLPESQRTRRSDAETRGERIPERGTKP